YVDGLLKSGRDADVDLDGVMALESLLPGSRELSFRLTCRMGKLMALLDRDPIRCREDIHAAYGLRSKYAHGDAGEVRKMLTKLNATPNGYLQLLERLFE